MNNSSSCIELSDVSFRWPEQKHNLLAINSLHIQSGESVFIHGASGSGKSTLLNMLAGVISPTSGEIKILNQTVNTQSQAQRDQIRADHYGIIFQQFNLIPYLSVIENITLPLSFSSYKQRRTLSLSSNINEQAIYLLESLGLDKDIASQNVTDLSTGQQQRTAAARAMMGSPEIIIADEPTSALDADTKHDFIELLFQETKKFNSTLIFVSHDQSLASQFDRAISINALKPIN